MVLVPQFFEVYCTWNKTSKQDFLRNWVVGWTSYVVSIFVGVKCVYVCVFLGLELCCPTSGDYQAVASSESFEHPLISQASTTRVFMVGL